MRNEISPSVIIAGTDRRNVFRHKCEHCSRIRYRRGGVDEYPIARNYALYVHPHPCRLHGHFATLVAYGLDGGLLSHQTGTLIPAAAGATAILIVNAGLLMYVFRFDKEVRKRGEGSNRPPEGGDDCLLSAPRYTSSRIRVIG